MKGGAGQFPSADVAPAVSPALVASSLCLHWNRRSRGAQRGHCSELGVSLGFRGSSLMLSPREGASSACGSTWDTRELPAANHPQVIHTALCALLLKLTLWIIYCLLVSWINYTYKWRQKKTVTSVSFGSGKQACVNLLSNISQTVLFSNSWLWTSDSFL